MKRGVILGGAIAAVLILGGAGGLLWWRPESVRSLELRPLPPEAALALKRIDEGLAKVAVACRRIDERARTRSVQPTQPDPLDLTRADIELESMQYSRNRLQQLLQLPGGEEEIRAGVSEICRAEAAPLHAHLDALQSWLPDTVHERALRDELEGGITQYVQGYFRLAMAVRARGDSEQPR